VPTPIPTELTLPTEEEPTCYGLSAVIGRCDLGFNCAVRRILKPSNEVVWVKFEGEEQEEISKEEVESNINGDSSLFYTKQDK